MASAIKTNRMYKFESMRVEWTLHFQKDHTSYLTVKNFFDNFHESHKGMQFAVGKIFDGTTHVLVDPDNYRKIKAELARVTGKDMPEVSSVSDVSIINNKVIFEYPRGTSYRQFSFSLKAKNDEIKQRKKQEADIHANELLRTIQKRPSARVMAFDVEVYEHDNSILLEVGFVVTTFDSTASKKCYHYIINENMHFKNKDEVPDNRDRFAFGTSQRMSLRQALANFRRHLAQTDVLVTHSGFHDEAYLSTYGISLKGKPMFDTQILATALMSKGPSLYGLKRLLRDLAIPFDEDILHNAGNDALYTMQVFCALRKILETRSKEAERLAQLVERAVDRAIKESMPNDKRKDPALGIETIDNNYYIKCFLVALFSFMVLAILQYILKS